MTGKRTRDNPPKKVEAGTSGTTTAEGIASGNAAPEAPKLDAAAAKASVHEAIGKLIGDDAERRRGTADKEASGVTPENPRKPPSH